MKRRMLVGGNSDWTPERGFTIVELLVVVLIIAMLAAIIVVAYNSVQDRSYFSTASADLNSIAKSMKTYKTHNGSLPPDTSVGIPAPIVELMTGKNETKVDTGTWPGSYYDYEVWDLDYDGTDDTYQISIRFCRDNNGNPQGENGPNCTFPSESWAEDFAPESSVYYCLEGFCRSHKWVGGTSLPGYCLNCPNNQAIPVS